MAQWKVGTSLNMLPEKGKAGEYTLRAFPDQIKYSGVVDFDSLYRAMVNWFKERNYDFYETLYKDKPPELELEWTAKKKLDEFYQHNIKMTFHLWDIKEVEAIKDGEKKKMMYTRMMIMFEVYLNIDWQGRWQAEAKNKPLMAMLFKFYVENVIKRELQLKYADPLTYEYYKLHAMIKEQLGMEAGSNAY